MEHSNPTWKWNRKLQKVVDVLSTQWWHDNGDDVLAWMQSEGIDDWNVHYDDNRMPILFLYTDKQCSYFKLRWKQ